MHTIGVGRTLWAIVAIGMHSLLVSAAACSRTGTNDEVPDLYLDAATARVVVSGETEELSGLLGPVQLNAGRHVVAGSFDPVLLVFERSGEPPRRLSVEGSGPGEYQQISGIFRYRADSVLVADRRSGRATVLDLRMRATRSIN